MKKNVINQEPIGKCKYCTINLYLDKETNTPKPLMLPCYVSRDVKWKDEKNNFNPPFMCPWENKEQQKNRDVTHEYEIFAGLLGTMYGDPELSE